MSKNIFPSGKGTQYSYLSDNLSENFFARSFGQFLNSFYYYKAVLLSKMTLLRNPFRKSQAKKSNRVTLSNTLASNNAMKTQS